MPSTGSIGGCDPSSTTTTPATPAHAARNRERPSASAASAGTTTVTSAAVNGPGPGAGCTAPASSSRSTSRDEGTSSPATRRSKYRTPAALRRNSRSGEPPMTTSASPGRWVDAVEHVAACSVRCTTLRDASVRSRHARATRRRSESSISAASSRRPCSGVAPAGSPSTPLGLTARTPSVRSRPANRPIGSVDPAAARSSRTAAGSSASISDVSVMPAWASPSATAGHQASAARPSAVIVPTAASTAGRLPPCPLTRTSPAAQSAERASSIRTSVSTAVPIDSVPGNAACSPLAVTASVGPTTTSGRRSASAAASASAITVSVSRGRCGPCCSHEPTGTQTSGERSAASSVQVRELSLTRRDGTGSHASTYPHDRSVARMRSAAAAGSRTTVSVVAAVGAEAVSDRTRSSASPVGPARARARGR